MSKKIAQSTRQIQAQPRQRGSQPRTKNVSSQGTDNAGWNGQQDICPENPDKHNAAGPRVFPEPAPFQRVLHPRLKPVSQQQKWNDWNQQNNYKDQAGT